MASCKDCLSFEVCECADNLEYADVEKLKNDCPRFKNKADFVEVVRCRDCKDYSPVMFKGEPMHYGYCCNTHDSVLGSRHRYEGDFCSYGERKEK